MRQCKLGEKHLKKGGDMSRETSLTSDSGTGQDTIGIVAHLSDRYKNMPSEGLREKGAEYLCQKLVPSTDLVFLSGRGVVLETNNGTFYDFGSMSLNCLLGQNDPWVNANLVSYIMSGSPSYATTSAGTALYYEVAEKLSRLSGIKDAVVNHRQCNGSDVAELAIVAAYKHRKKGQRYVVSFKGSYHGQNLTSYAVSDLQQENRFLVSEEASTIFLDTPTHTQPEDDQTELSENDKHILESLKKVGQEAFAVIIEPIQVNNRVNISSRLFLASLKELCGQLDIPLIFDDIQIGYGWIGTFSSTEYFGVVPNMMAVSKALTSGYGPLAALIMDPKYGDLPDSTVRKTNGADMRSLVAAKSVIERLSGIEKELIPDDLDETLKQELENGLLASFPEKESSLRAHLTSLQMKYPKLFGELRGAGLIWSIDIVDEDGKLDFTTCKMIQQALLESGVFVRDVRGALLFKVPIVFKENELQQGFDIIDSYLQTLRH